MNPTHLETNFIKDIENQEVLYWSSYYYSASSNLKKNIEIKSVSIDGAFCGAVKKADVLAFNRVIGAGLESPITEELLDKIISFYKTAGIPRFFLQLSPASEPENSGFILREKGFIHHNNWAKSYKIIDNFYNSSEPVSIVEIASLKETELFDNIIRRSFEFNEDEVLLGSQNYGRHGWHHYIAKNGNESIAAAALFICGKYASLAIAGTLKEYRNKGAQSALIKTRINIAKKTGCKYIVVETGEDKPENPSASYRNMKKHGFKLAYLRPNYIFYT